MSRTYASCTVRRQADAVPARRHGNVRTAYSEGHRRVFLAPSAVRRTPCRLAGTGQLEPTSPKADAKALACEDAYGVRRAEQARRFGPLTRSSQPAPPA